MLNSLLAGLLVRIVCCYGYVESRSEGLGQIPQGTQYEYNHFTSFVKQIRGENKRMKDERKEGKKGIKNENE